MNEHSLSVTQLNFFIRNLLDADVRLAHVVVCGEISNFSGHYSSGHLYFTLKDENSAVRAVMFKSNAVRLRFRPEDGMKVIVKGRVSVYERDGIYQIYVSDIQPDGVGSLTVAFEQLKNKLEKQGLFAPEHKKKLPAFPKRIGIVTSPTGAAVQDMIHIIGRRWPLCQLVLCPVTVQGSQAPQEIISAIRRLNAGHLCDVMIVGRGGGSAEDLWCFNDEQLAHAVFKSEIPVVSAVGHETDFTVCDFAADLRAPTPSAAAELTTPDCTVLMQTVDSLQERMRQTLAARLKNERTRLSALQAAGRFSSPTLFLRENSHTLALAQTKLQASFQRFLSEEKNKLISCTSKLDSLSPLKIIARGYAVVMSEDRVLTKTEDMAVHDTVSLILSDGSAVCEVLDIEKKV